MNNKRLTEDQKKEIISLYKQNYTIKAISERVGCSCQSVNYNVAKQGISRKKGGQRKCHHCGRKLQEIAGAKFCPYCGGSIQTPRELAIEKAQTLFSAMELLPAGERDKSRETVIGILDYLKGVKG